MSNVIDLPPPSRSDVDDRVLYDPVELNGPAKEFNEDMLSSDEGKVTPVVYYKSPFHNLM